MALVVLEVVGQGRASRQCQHFWCGGALNACQGYSWEDLAGREHQTSMPSHPARWVWPWYSRWSAKAELRGNVNISGVEVSRVAARATPGKTWRARNTGHRCHRPNEVGVALVVLELVGQGRVSRQCNISGVEAP